MARVYTEEDKKRVIQFMVDNPTLTNQQVFERCGVCKSTFYHWKREPWFQEMYHQLCQARFKELESLAVKRLGEQVDTGVFSAIKYVLDGRGYNATQKVDVNVPTVINVSIEGDE